MTGSSIGLLTENGFIEYCFYIIRNALCVSALTVRFLTRRYIGEYDHQAGKLSLHHTGVLLWGGTGIIPVEGSSLSSGTLPCSSEPRAKVSGDDRKHITKKFLQ